MRQLIRGVKIKIATPEFFTLYHFLGNPQMIFFLKIYNIGGRSIYFKINCVIKDSNENKWELPAHTYISQQSSQPGSPPQEILIGVISLKSGEYWGETLHCFKLWTETEEEQTNEIITKIRKDIFDKYPFKPPSQPKVEADEIIVKEAKDFFDRKFNLHKGNYQLFITLLSESDKVLHVHGFDFTLYESNIRALREHTEQYKYGEGIYYPIADSTKYVSVRVRPMTEEQAKGLYKKMELV